MRLVALGDIAALQAGVGFPPQYQGMDSDELPFAKVGDVSRAGRSGHGVLTKTDNYIDRETAAALKARPVPAGSILFAKIGEAIRQNHRVKVTQPTVFDNNVMAVVPKPLIDSQYLFRYLQCIDLYRLATSTTVPSLRKSVLEQIQVPLPSLDEQRRIIAILDKADAIRIKRREALAHLNCLTQSIFIQLFGNPVTNSGEWPTTALEDIGTLDRGVSKHRPRNDARLLDGPYPLIQTGDVASSGGYITQSSSSYSELGLAQSKIWPSGTLCITIAANIAKTGILKIDACFPDSVVGFVATPERTEFVRHWFGFFQEIIEKRAPESAQKNINLAVLRRLSVIDPPLELQQEFAKRVIALERLKEKHQGQLADLDTLFVSLQSRAFKGDL